jgi:hypothetical protein
MTTCQQRPTHLSPAQLKLRNNDHFFWGRKGGPVVQGLIVFFNVFFETNNTVLKDHLFRKIS